MSTIERALDELLGRYMSPILAQSVRRRAQKALGVSEGALAAPDLGRLRIELEAGVRLFVDASLHQEVLGAVTALGPVSGGSGGPASPRPGDRFRVELAAEADVVQARTRARQLAERLGADAFGTQRVATAASELARNAVLYAGGGWIEFMPARSPLRGVVMLATDSGPGIADLELVLSGKYRSRTGLGRGLLGVKRLARAFDVRTGPGGTRIEAEIAL